MIPDALKGLPPEFVESLRKDCRGDWRRLRFNTDGSITILNRPAEAEKPAPPPEPTPAPEPVKPPVPRARHDPRDMAPPERDNTPRGNGLRARGVEAAVAPVVEKAPPPPPETVERLRELLPPAPVQDEPERLPYWGTPYEEGPAEGFERGMYRGDITSLREKIAEAGFLGAIKYHPDVLDLEEMPFEDAKMTIRNPTRVEIRPETYSKKYPVLSLHRGDIQVIMGFEFRDSPAIIAVYWTHLLGHDDGRFKRGATGAGGGRRKVEGLPNTPSKVVSRLRGMGVEIPEEDTMVENQVAVFYKGQNLGKITVGNIYPKDKPQADYQRIARKVDAINRRGVSV